MTHMKASQLTTREVVVVLDNANGKSQSIACRFLWDVSAKNSITNHTRPSSGGCAWPAEEAKEKDPDVWMPGCGRRPPAATLDRNDAASKHR